MARTKYKSYGKEATTTLVFFLKHAIYIYM